MCWVWVLVGVFLGMAFGVVWENFRWMNNIFSSDFHRVWLADPWKYKVVAVGRYGEAGRKDLVCPEDFKRAMKGVYLEPKSTFNHNH